MIDIVDMYLNILDVYLQNLRFMQFFSVDGPILIVCLLKCNLSIDILLYLLLYNIVLLDLHTPLFYIDTSYNLWFLYRNKSISVFKKCFFLEIPFNSTGKVWFEVETHVFR